MKDRIVILGGGGHALVVAGILKRLKRFEIIGYTDIENNGELLGLPYLGDDSILEPEKYSICIGIGQIKNIRQRRNIIEGLVKRGFVFPNIVSPGAFADDSAEIGDGTVVVDGAIINPKAKIGKFSIINTSATIDHNVEIGDFVHIAPGVNISGDVKIGNNSLIGIGASIIQGVEICDNVIIGAGAAVLSDIEKQGTYVGIPARIL